LCVAPQQEDTLLNRLTSEIALMRINQRAADGQIDARNISAGQFNTSPVSTFATRRFIGPAL
jgi:hypothetical protein